MIEFAQNSYFEFLSPEYETLFIRSSATAFQHPLWLDRIFRHLVSEQNLEPCVLTGRSSDDGRLVFLFPMLRRRYGPLSFLHAADMGVSDYNSLVIDPTCQPAICNNPEIQRRLWKALEHPTLVVLRRLHSNIFSEATAFAPHCQSLMGYSAHETAIFPPFQDWRARTFNEGFGRFLDRKRRQLFRKGQWSLEELADPNRIREAFLLMRRLREDRWPKDPQNLLRDDVYFNFYCDIAASGQPLALARTYLISVSNRPVAVIFGLAHKGRFMFLLMGFDTADFRNYSLGLLALESVIEDCIARGDQTFDLTIGDEPYKKEFRTHSTPMLAVWVGTPPIPTLMNLAYTSLLKWRSLRSAMLRD